MSTTDSSDILLLYDKDGRKEREKERKKEKE